MTLKSSRENVSPMYSDSDGEKEVITVNGVESIVATLTQMSSENSQTNWITLVAAVLAAGASILSAALLFYSKRTESYINVITSNRIAWMEGLRGLTDEFIRRTQPSKRAAFFADAEKRTEYFDELFGLRNRIVLKLNCKGPIDQNIISSVNEVVTRMELFYEINDLLGMSPDGRIKYLHEHYSDQIKLENLEALGLKEECVAQAAKLLDKEPSEVAFGLKTSLASTRFDVKFRETPKRLVQEIQEEHNRLIKLVHVYLKLEWDRVKEESKGRFISPKKDEYRAIADEALNSYILRPFDYSHNKLPTYFGELSAEFANPPKKNGSDVDE